MNNKSIGTTVRYWIAGIGWKIYVRFFWAKNEGFRKKLTKDIAENLVHYIRNGHPDFK